MSPAGQTADGWWEVGVRRTLPLDLTSAWAALRALLEDDGAVRSIRSETPRSVVRATYQPEGWTNPSTLQLRVLSVPTGSTLAIHHEHLPDSDAREAMRQHWTMNLQRIVDSTT